MTYPIRQPPDDDAAYAWTPDVRAAIAGVNDHQTRLTTLEALPVVTGKRRLRVADLPRPLVIPHRGAGANLAPENTMVGFRIGASYGLGLVDGGDWNVTSDGALVCIHDSTVDRTTTGTGNVSLLTSQRAQFLPVDPSTWFGPGFPDTVLPTAEQVFGEIGDVAVITPEPKSQAAADACAALVQRLGLQEFCIPNAFSTFYLAPFVAVGCTDVLLNVTVMPDAPTMASYLAAGIKWIGIPTTFTAANVNTLTAAGFEVMVGTVQRASEATPFAGSTVSMWAADDPLYFSHALNSANAAKYRRLTDPFANAMYYHGHIARIGTFGARGTYVGTNRWGYQTAISGSNLWTLQGWACPIAAAASTYSITLTITYDAVGSDSARWAGIWFGAPTDVVYSDAAAATENGYQVWLRVTGSLNLVSKVNGTSGTTQTQATAAISAGGTATIRIDVTPTTVTATRTDVSAPNSVTLTHNTNRGGYWHLGRNDNAGASGLNVSFSNITIA